MTESFDQWGFPLQKCRRCDGTGHYSYCRQNGTKCFDCGGKGICRTAAGQRQYDLWQRAKAELEKTPNHLVKVGDEIWFWGGFESRRGWWPVTGIEESDVKGQTYRTFTVKRGDRETSITYIGDTHLVRVKPVNELDPQPFAAKSINRRRTK
jgi:hypothetical protein